jgi:hypothetical protein
MQIQLKVGDRIRLLAMPQDPHPVTVGSIGKVVAIHDHHEWVQVDVDWEDGRRLMLTVPPDRFDLLDEVNKTIVESFRESRVQESLARINEKYSDTFKRLAE